MPSSSAPLPQMFFAQWPARRPVQMIEVRMRHQHQIDSPGKSRTRTPDAATGFSTNNQRAKLGSIITLCPPICTKKLEWTDEG